MLVTETVALKVDLDGVQEDVSGCLDHLLGLARGQSGGRYEGLASTQVDESSRPSSSSPPKMLLSMGSGLLDDNTKKY